MNEAFKLLENGNLGIFLVFIIYKLTEYIWQNIKNRKTEIDMPLTKEQDDILRGTYREIKNVSSALSRTDMNGRPLHVFPPDAVEQIRNMTNKMGEVVTTLNKIADKLERMEKAG